LIGSPGQLLRWRLLWRDKRIETYSRAWIAVRKLELNRTS
jgi:hypothetical protein